MGGFDETFFLAADQELMTRYILKDVPFYFENAVLANFTHGGATTQTKNQNQLIEESIKICQKHNLDTLLHKKHSKDLKKKKWSWR